MPSPNQARRAAQNSHSRNEQILQMQRVAMATAARCEGLEMIIGNLCKAVERIGAETGVDLSEFMRPPDEVEPLVAHEHETVDLAPGEIGNVPTSDVTLDMSDDDLGIVRNGLSIGHVITDELAETSADEDPPPTAN